MSGNSKQRRTVARAKDRRAPYGAAVERERRKRKRMRSDWKVRVDWTASARSPLEKEMTRRFDAGEFPNIARLIRDGEAQIIT